MALKGASLGASAAGTSSSPEKHKAPKRKKDRSKVQNAWLETVSRTRERYPLPSLHLRISFTEISRHGLGRWSHARKPGNENIEVVRTKSQAGMCRPRRLPTIYKSNSRLFIDTFECQVAKKATRGSKAIDSEKHTVMVDLPERVEMQIASETSEKYSVVVGIPNALQIRLSSNTGPVEQGPSRFEELNDDGSVHELEAVYPSSSTAAPEVQTPRTVILCEADDPTALPTLEFLQRSFTMGIKQHRPKISLSIPRSKSLHILPDSGALGTAVVVSPSSPYPSTSLYRSLTQMPTMRYSIISPLTPIDMPRPMRPYSTISVPLFMEVTDLAQATDEVPPLPMFAATIAESGHGCHDAKPSTLLCEAPAQELEEGLHRARVREDRASPPSPSPSEEADIEDDEDPSPQRSRSITRRTMAQSINKPLPPEPRMVIPAALPPLAYKPRQVKAVQAQETLPRSRYSPMHTGKFDDFKKLASAKCPSLDEAIEELEWRRSSIGARHSESDCPRPKTPIQVSRGLMLMKPSRPPPPVPRPVGGGALQRPREAIARCRSARHASVQSRGVYEKKTRSWQGVKWSVAASEGGEPPLVEESETWYRTASERSSAELSQSVFSDAGTDGTCQTEQSNGQEKAKEKEKVEKEKEKVEKEKEKVEKEKEKVEKEKEKVEKEKEKVEKEKEKVEMEKEKEKVEMEKEKEKVEVEKEREWVIDRSRLPQAMQSCGVPARVAEVVILRIMSNLTTLKDLFATAALNKGFYNTFKRHEMYLIKAALFKSSAAAWELREVSEEKPITPTAYLRHYSVEIYTMGMLKSLILVQCESFLRPTTIAGLVGTDQVRSGEIDAAFWRVWTFCRLFGSSAGEGEDVEAQIDWLNGGPAAQRRDRSSPFGIGNGPGLSRSELYDMTELWTCLSVLVQTFHGRVGEARAAGIYQNCKVEHSRDEEVMLEEWTWYLLTLGPSCVLALAPGSFSTAKELGLTEWAPPAPGPDSSRSKFFKKALTRVYEARLMEEAKAKGGRVKRASTASHRTSKSEEARELHRARQTAFAQEIKCQRQHSPSKAEPWTFSDERPMSVYSQVVKSLPHRAGEISAQDLAAMPKGQCQGSASRRSSANANANASAEANAAGPATPPSPQSPALTGASAIPSAEDEIPASLPTLAARHSPIITIEEVANERLAIVDPTDRAMAHIVDVLGFSKEEAKWALTRSETGHGLDVEKAIELLVGGSPVSSRPSSRERVHRPVEVESSIARPDYIRKRIPVRALQQRDSIVTTDEMTEKEKERANIMRMREKSYRVLGIGAPQGGKKFGSTVGKRLSRR